MNRRAGDQVLATHTVLEDCVGSNAK
jgi:hypothetical protein